MRLFILLLPGETGRLPTKAANSANDKVPLPSASIAATNARTSAGEASRFVIFKPVRNISSTSWTDSSPERSRSYFLKNRSSGRGPHFALSAFLSLSCVFMSRGFLTVRLKRWVARLALVARRMVVLCLLCGVVSAACVSRLGGARRRREDSCGAWAALRRAGQPFAGAKRSMGSAQALPRRGCLPTRDGGGLSGASGSVRGGASRPPLVGVGRDGSVGSEDFRVCPPSMRAGVSWDAEGCGGLTPATIRARACPGTSRCCRSLSTKNRANKPKSCAATLSLF